MVEGFAVLLERWRSSQAWDRAGGSTQQPDHQTLPTIHCTVYKVHVAQLHAAHWYLLSSHTAGTAVEIFAHCSLSTLLFLYLSYLFVSLQP